MVGLTGLAASSITSVATAQRAENHLPKGLAKKAAEKQVFAASQQPRFTEWKGASIGSPTVYYRKNASMGPAYLRSAYVFPVMDGSDSVGYVTTAAHRTEGPIIEYSKAPSPNEHLARVRNTGAKRGKTEKVPLYHGGLKYCLGFADDTAMNVMNGQPHPMNDGIAQDALATTTATTQWDIIQNTSQTTDNGLVPNDVEGDVSTNAYPNEDYVPAVPAWTETDSGGASSTSYGDGPDAWASWDGCLPVAASMLIGSHENFPRPENDYAREAMIDRLHNYMNTSYDGYTTHSDAVDGIREYDNHHGSYTYFPNQAVNFDKEYIRNEVSAERPILLSIDGGSKDWDHVVTVVGYSNNCSTLRIHNTWDTYAHNYNWGNWDSATLIQVDVSPN